MVMEKDSPLSGRKIVFVGKLGGLTKKEALQVVREYGGIPLEKISSDASWVVLGADLLPSLADENLLPSSIRERIDQGEIELLSETDFWHRLGKMDVEQNIRQLYTPAMLAQLLELSVREIRRWRRLGLIKPIKEIHRLPYFDFQEVVNARRLAELLAQGTSPQVIEEQLVQLSKLYPDAERPLSQLSILVEGRHVLLRGEGKLKEPRGQLRIDFDSLEEQDELGESNIEQAIPLQHPSLYAKPSIVPTTSYFDRDKLLNEAVELEEEGELLEAISIYRLILAHDGPSADICFQLAELLYRNGEVSAACERYFVAVEIDTKFVEARANLGCVLAELGHKDLAIAVFQGALELHEEYSDVHYHLAQTLDEMGRGGEAISHWQRFIELTPSSPWAEQARIRLNSL
jgi:tetratricopeptide (TPR) repeat protein